VRDNSKPKVLILGATSPIARALAMRFARDGASFYLAARDTGEATRIAQDIGVRTGAVAHSGTFEAGHYASHPKLIDTAAQVLGGLDGVVLCFGTLGDETAAQRDPVQTVEVINQNFTAAASILTVVADRLESQQSGFIIVIGSVAGDRGRARNYVYGSAKGALALYTQGLRGRFARSKVHVMTAILGTVDTRMTWGREGTLLSVPPDRVAHGVYQAWRRKSDVVYVPFFWRFIMGGLKMIPERFFKQLRF
jgi:decaprenylphospho-beta-D-erythro-pentofuranosid-2-ulose 2-reductase